MTNRRRPRWLSVLLLALVMFLPALALAGPRSGGSFSGRSGFRSAPSYSQSNRSYDRSYSGGGSHFIVVPHSGWGWGHGYGYGYGGGSSIIGTLLVLVVVAFGVSMLMRAVRRRAVGPGGGLSALFGPSAVGADESSAVQARAYVYKLQIALGRAARGIQERLATLAAQGDTASEAGLARLLQQCALDFMRYRDSIRYAAADARGPMSLTNAETAMNAVALAERSRFQLERVRVADGRAERSDAPAEEGKEALELVVVTVLAATRTPLERFRAVSSPDELVALLTELGSVSSAGLLALDVIWTPADANDSMTETDVMTTYPELRSL